MYYECVCWVFRLFDIICLFSKCIKTLFELLISIEYFACVVNVTRYYVFLRIAIQCNKARRPVFYNSKKLIYLKCCPRYVLTCLTIIIQKIFISVNKQWHLFKKQWWCYYFPNHIVDTFSNFIISKNLF